MAATNLPPGPTNLAIYEPDMPAINPAINNPSIPNPSAFRKPAPLPMGMSPDRNLANLFNTLNTISANAVNQMLGERAGGGTGGGSEPTEGNMDANPLIALNPYISKNVSSFEHGGALKSSLQKIAGELSKASQMHKKQSEKIGSMSEKFNMGGAFNLMNQNVGGIYSNMADMLIASMQAKNVINPEPPTMQDGGTVSARMIMPEIRKTLMNLNNRRRKGGGITEEQKKILGLETFARPVKTRNFTKGGRF
tara:strand:+ start:1185 stop:1937 length:753 start_codon:yes stop_codon:yes gene_type:complete